MCAAVAQALRSRAPLSTAPSLSKGHLNRFGGYCGYFDISTSCPQYSWTPTAFCISRPICWTETGAVTCGDNNAACVGNGIEWEALPWYYRAIAKGRAHKVPREINSRPAPDGDRCNSLELRGGSCRRIAFTPSTKVVTFGGLLRSLNVKTMKQP
jgi:hypothetical protein